MSFHLVTVFHVPDLAISAALQEKSITEFDCQGIEEYTLNEEEVDNLLGERSYSGGDLPLSVLDEVDETMNQGDIHLKFFFGENDLSLAEDFVRFVKNNYLSEVQIQTLSDQDWNAEWKKHYHPIHVTNELVVLPEWSTEKVQSGQLEVRIHPGMGFGTGSHETTFLCLKNFMGLKFDQKFSEVLDYGSGSGILGIAALIKFPAWTADFVDIDDDAHANCTQNLNLNSLSLDRTRMILVPERSKLKNEYGLVFANILENILHEECNFLIQKTAINGYLILSGLLQNQVQRTRELYLENGQLELVNEEIKNDWGCLVFRKSK